MKLTKIIVITPNYILLNNTKYNLEYAQFFPGTDQSDQRKESWQSLNESAVVGIWPETVDSNEDNKKKIKLMLRLGPDSRSKPFFISKPDDFLIRMPKIGCLHISVAVSESATTITVNTYFPGAAP